jgi:hypothetical protein
MLLPLPLTPLVLHALRVLPFLPDSTVTELPDEVYEALPQRHHAVCCYSSFSIPNTSILLSNTFNL